MARFLNKSASGLGMLTTVGQFVSVLRELSFDDLKEQAVRPPHLLVLSPYESEAAELGRQLTGVTAGAGLTTRALNDALQGMGRFDAVVLHDPEGTGVGNKFRANPPSWVGDTPVFVLPGRGLAAERDLPQLRAEIVLRTLDRRMAFGRYFPEFREATVHSLINETAKANAQFAMVSNLPSVVPIVGSLVAASADALILTKNQLMLIYKIAAAHGRNLENQHRIFQEMVPVIGAGLVWRTLAREATSFIPLAGGTIPKVAIAYAGTIAAGRGADYYYRYGEKPSSARLRGYYNQAADVIRTIPGAMPAIPFGKDVPKDVAYRNLVDDDFMIDEQVR